MSVKLVYTNSVMSIPHQDGDVEPDGRPAHAVPRYIQIAEQLIAQIESGELVPGDRLPPERELSRQVGVNRPTLRQALGLLKSRGLISQRQGDGTYIAEPKIDRAAGRLWPFSKSMRSLGYAPKARIILLERRQADATTREQLALPAQAMVYYSHRLRLIGREPVVLEQFALPAARFANFEQHNLVDRSIYEIMEVEYGVVVGYARQILEPVVATPYEAELLGIAAGAPLMLEQRVAFDQHGLPVEYSKDLYRGDRFRFVTDLAPIDEDSGPRRVDPPSRFGSCAEPRPRTRQVEDQLR